MLELLQFRIRSSEVGPIGPKSDILEGAAVWLRLVSLSLEKGLPDPGTQGHRSLRKGYQLAAADLLQGVAS